MGKKKQFKDRKRRPPVAGDADLGEEQFSSLLRQWKNARPVADALFGKLAEAAGSGEVVDVHVERQALT